MIAWAQRNAQGFLFTAALSGIGVGLGAWIHWGAGVLAPCLIIVGAMMWTRAKG
jgi:hypothetical protein